MARSRRRRAQFGDVPHLSAVSAPARRSALLAVAAAVVAGCGSSAATPPVQVRTVTLFAAASTAAVMAREIVAFERVHPETHIAGDYEGTQSLLTKLQADPAVADVFLSADRSHMTTAFNRSLVVNPRDVAGNRLIVALPPGNPAHITALGDLARSGVRLVLADKSVPAGNYAEQALHAAETNGDAPRGFAAAALANAVSRETDVEAVVAKVATGVADAGIVYATDAVADRRITALAIPAADQPATVYPIAVTTHAHNPGGASDFMAFLLSSDGQKILREAGFTIPLAPAGASATP